MISREEMRERFDKIKGELREAQKQSGLQELFVPEILPVSKFHPVEAILRAQELGLNHFAENRVQELLAKRSDPRLENCSFDLIGSLQTNKVKAIVGKVRLIHSLDRESLLKSLEKHAAAQSLQQDVLLQVNYSGEESKHGITAEEIPVFLEKIALCPHVRLRGLMTMAAPGLTEEEQNTFFTSFKALFDETRERLSNQEAKDIFNVLSMGMSDDFLAAVRAGSTCIRLGRALFGEREY